MVSKRKTAANRTNAAKSTGPKTEAGKQNSKFNAVSVGFYGRELRVGDDDKPEFEALRTDLGEQLMPRTALQRLAFEQLLTCGWRVKLALRLETSQLSARLAATTERQGDVQDDTGKEEPLQSFWMTDASIGRALRMLDTLQNEAEHSGLNRIAGDRAWKESLTAVFGTGFFDLLWRFKDVNVTALQFTRHIVAQSRMFGWKVPFVDSPEPQEAQSGLAEGEHDKDADELPHELQLTMVLSTIELQRQHLKALLKARQQGDTAQLAVSTEFPRYFSEACRDWQRALDGYLKLRKKRL